MLLWGGDAQAAPYSPLDQITRENMDQFERAFVYHTGDTPSPEAAGEYAPETKPLKVGTTSVYALISIDAAMGEENWRYDPGMPEAPPLRLLPRLSLWMAPQAAEQNQDGPPEGDSGAASSSDRRITTASTHPSADAH